MKAIIVFIIIFSVIVIFHEFGHFIMAKRSGIMVREFAIGMGPRIFHYEGEETTYTLRLLPIGGYVRMAGLEDMDEVIEPGRQIKVGFNDDQVIDLICLDSNEEDIEALPLEVMDSDLSESMYIHGVPFGETESKKYSVSPEAYILEENGSLVKIAPLDKQFQSAPLINRLLTNIMGPINNFILGILAFILIAFLQGGVYSNAPILGEMVEDSAAQEAGLESGDRVIKINDEKIDSFTDMQKIVSQHPGQEVNFTVERDQEQKSIAVQVGAVETNKGQKIGQIGVRAPQNKSFGAKIAYGFKATWAIVVGIISAIASMVVNGFDINNFGGPVYMYQATSQTVEVGFIAVLQLMAYLTVNLGIVNLLPFPALDGGKAFLNIIEAIRGKALSVRTEGIINLIGFVLLMVLMIAVTWNDILRLF
ncbi:MULTISPECIES: RIP metalloprotease RseP [Aerococcus]|uniref:RIP metalloprotease RseP n=1 Tax=Aerococcus TaxID=1375 RepID=UPI0018A7BAAE|nr:MULTISPECIES: RIP metalloprotease RseP [Aerococcus]MCY3035827.1 RIP metalloprotease RseP [Aerococcus sp. Group 2]MCY3038922.1 RIP metalloprotease RseP [Aerococcus sp. Group 2]MCY3040494.1 RIP metalloprotease RseP [Aerococcus sp. Group 2]MCY3042491.1 RIP metalloprotease RseP [Aerococcus sp. Group 2]MDK6519939.1 RIP metalloprotease RseP [Aerococcus urinae]